MGDFSRRFEGARTRAREAPARSAPRTYPASIDEVARIQYETNRDFAAMDTASCDLDDADR